MCVLHFHLTSVIVRTVRDHANRVQVFIWHDWSNTQAEMVAHWGYPVEEYDVITTGYILNMIRIPRARASKSKINFFFHRTSQHQLRFETLNIFWFVTTVFLADNSTCHRPPILMVHGVMVDATEYVINPSASSPGKHTDWNYERKRVFWSRTCAKWWYDHRLRRFALSAHFRPLTVSLARLTKISPEIPRYLENSCNTS